MGNQKRLNFEDVKLLNFKHEKRENFIDVSFETKLSIPHGDLISDVNQSLHFEKHAFYIQLEQFRLSYSLNGNLMLILNDLDLLSIETLRN